MDPTSKIILRIQRLLALAKDQEGTPEGDAAAAAAYRVMQAHSIEQMDLDYATRQAEDPLTKESFSLGKRSQWRRNLANIIGTHTGCKMLWRVGGSQVTLFGHKSSVAIAEYLYIILHRQVEAAANKNSVENYWGYDPGHRRKLYNDFCHSAVAALHSRLERMRNQAAAENPTGTQLVLARTAVVADYYNKNKGKVLTAEPTAFDFNEKGYRAGLKMSLHEAVEATVDAGPKRITG